MKVKTLILSITVTIMVLSTLFVPAVAIAGEPEGIEQCCPAHDHLRYVDHTWIDSGGDLWVQYRCYFPGCAWSENINLGHVVGPQGETGPAGEQGIQGLQGDVGPQGEQGPAGSGISEIYLTETGQLVIVLTNGDNFTSEISLIGAQGDKGDPGAAGFGGSGPAGPQGEPGLQGAPGATGQSGKDGVGVTDASVDASGHLILALSDGTIKDAGKVIGPQGETGPRGDPGQSYDQSGTGVIAGVAGTESGSSFRWWYWLIMTAIAAAASLATYLIWRRRYLTANLNPPDEFSNAAPGNNGGDRE